MEFEEVKEQHRLALEMLNADSIDTTPSADSGLPTPQAATPSGVVETPDATPGVAPPLEEAASDGTVGTIETVKPVGPSAEDLRFLRLEERFAESTRALMEQIARQSATPTSVAAVPTPVAVAPLYTEEEAEDAMVDPKKFSALLQRVHGDALSKAREEIASIRAEAPGLAIQRIQEEQNAVSLRDKFYETNEDLKPLAPFVGLVAEKINATNPGLSADEFMAATAAAVRQMMPAAPAPRSAPAFAQTPAAPAPPAPVKSRLQQQIESVKENF